MQFGSALEPLLDQVDVLPRRFPASFRFLLEYVQHIDCRRIAHCVDGAIGAAAVILDQFQHTGTAEAAQRLCDRRRLASLHGKQRDTEGTPDFLRQSSYVTAARRDPDESLW